MKKLILLLEFIFASNFLAQSNPFTKFVPYSSIIDSLIIEENNYSIKDLGKEQPARWLSLDPLADKYPGWSPYNYCMNNPVNLVDPDGRDVYKPNNANILALMRSAYRNSASYRQQHDAIKNRSDQIWRQSITSNLSKNENALTHSQWTPPQLRDLPGAYRLQTETKIDKMVALSSNSKSSAQTLINEATHVNEQANPHYESMMDVEDALGSIPGVPFCTDEARENSNKLFEDWGKDVLDVTDEELDKMMFTDPTSKENKKKEEK